MNPSASPSPTRLSPANLAQSAGWIGHLFKALFTQRFTELAPLFAPYVPRDGVVIDVGANSGQFTRLFAGMAPDGHVYAVEPSAYALSILRPAIRWSRRANVTIVPVGLSDTPQHARMWTPIKQRGGLGFGLAHLGEDQTGREVVPHDIELTTLDTMAAALKLSRVDFIKMDVEGWELNALRGGARTLKRFKPPIYLEVNHAHLARAGATPDELWGFLQGLGYAAMTTPELTPAPGYAGAGDYLWV